jgi:hypothetical protein
MPRSYKDLPLINPSNANEGEDFGLNTIRDSKRKKP